MMRRFDLTMLGWWALTAFAVGFERAAIPAAVLCLPLLGLHLLRVDAIHRRTGIRVAAAFLALWSVGVSLWHGVGIASWAQVARLVFGLALCVVLAESSYSARARWRMALAISAALICVAPFVTDWVADKLPLPNAGTWLPRAPGDRAHPNVMGGWLAISLPLLFMAAWRVPTVMRTWVLGLAITASVLLVLSQARAAWVAACLGMVLLCMSLGSARVRGAITLFLAVIALGSVALPFVRDAMLFSPNTPAGQPPATALEKRAELWNRGIDLLIAQPMTGIGMGTFAARSETKPYVRNLPGIPHVHNLPLQVALDTGLPGFAAWLYLVGSAIRLGVDGLHRRDPWRVALLSALCVLLCHGLVDAAAWGMVRPGVLTWPLVGSLLAPRQVGDGA